MIELSNNLEERVAALQGPLQAICTRLKDDGERLGMPADSAPELAKAAFDLKRDTFTGEYSLEAKWKADSNSHRGGSILIHPDGSFFAEYDVLLPHPDKPKCFVEAVTAWGNGETLKSEPRLLPMPEEDLPVEHELPDDLRLLIVHKQSTSGRLRFLRFSSTALAFRPLPTAPWQIDDSAAPELLHHPATLARNAAATLGIPADKMQVDGSFRVSLVADGKLISVQLALCISIDPPLAEADAIGACFVPITESRDLPLVERELMRAVYEHAIG